MKRFAFLAFSAFVLSAQGAATNPVWAVDCPDPTFWRAPDGSWRCTSTRLDILRSQDFFHWEKTGRRIFSDEEYQRIRRDWRSVWAPDAFRLGDEYLMFVSLVNNLRDSAVAVYSSKSPDGPFTDGRVLTRSRDTGIFDTIDPEAVRDDRTGELWLFFGSVGKVHRVRLAPDARSLAPGAVYEHMAGVHRDRDANPSRSKVFEGTYLHRRGGWWYLFASRGWYSDHTYAVVVGRAPTLDGPFLDRDGRRMKDGFATAVVSSGKDDLFFGPGHNGEIATIDGRDYLPFHCHVRGKSPKSRPLFVQELFWDADGWPYVRDGRVQKETQ
ncbi:MAG: family 43 glycosylhydrolase [Kiritimatiellae bacterium]|nr:family 43 glycosylhydrolase [Kiritimatiellia bacterium]